MTKRIRSIFLTTFCIATTVLAGENPVKTLGRGAIDRSQIRSAADGQSGMIAVWLDASSGGPQLVGQSLDLSGRLPWGKAPKRISSPGAQAQSYRIAAASRGGIVLTWTEKAADGVSAFVQIYRQGRRVWVEPGLKVATAPMLASVAADVDDRGRVTVAWELADGIQWQKFDGQGKPLLGPPHPLGKGVAAHQPFVVVDNQGGFAILWQSDSADAPLRAQYVNAAGKAFWDEAGMPVTTRSGHFQVEQARWADGNELAILWRTTDAAGTSWQGQHLAGTGQRMWGDEGVAVVDDTHDQEGGDAGLSPSGQLWTAWEDARMETRKVYVQKWTPKGYPVWGENLAVTGREEGEQREPLLAVGDKATFVVWKDSFDPPWRLVGQRLDDDGSRAWRNGVSFGVTAPNGPKPILAGYPSGYFLLWLEGSDPQNLQLQAIRVESSGGIAG